MKALAFSGGKDSMACLHLLRHELDCAIYVDTGYAYPETLALVEYARGMVPMHTVHADREGQNEREGVPSDVVPINWTRLGESLTGPKAVRIQSYLGCCYENLFVPMMAKAKEIGVTTLYTGQRAEENHKSAIQSGAVVDGIAHVYPINDWSEAQVMAFLARHMTIPAHYAIKHSSLDCFDCTAYRSDSADRIQWTRAAHPQLYGAYEKRAAMLDAALTEARRIQ